jgi:adenylate cyclase
MATVVFCDLVGSTGLFERLGDAAASRLVTQLNHALGRAVGKFEGRVVKTLGDGIFAVFAREEDAISACCQIQHELHDRPLMLFADTETEKVAMTSGTFRSLSVQLQIGIESGEVVEINGDCYGDAVNSASRLADLAGARQILTSQRVFDALPVHRQSELRSLGPMFLRGKGEATEVYSINWQYETIADPDATTIGIFRRPAARASKLVLRYQGRQASLQLKDGKSSDLGIGRAIGSELEINDSRVSRTHASVQVRGDQFVLTDTSSYGTWVYWGAQAEPLVLRRTDCVLVGEGELSLGCERSSDKAPVVSFSVTG